MSRLLAGALLATTLVAAASNLRAQSRAAALIDSARAQIAARDVDSAAILLHAALDTTAHATPAERKTALVWEGIVQFFRGHEDLTRASFREALALDTTTNVQGLERLSPELAQLFQQEKDAAVRLGFVYLPQAVDEQPRRLSAPPWPIPRACSRATCRGSSRCRRSSIPRGGWSRPRSRCSRPPTRA